MTTYAVKHSPNFNARPAGTRIRLIVLHADAGASEAGTISWLLSKQSKASYHYLVGRDGSVTQLVREEDRAWHAGVSEWAGVKGCNDYSLGLSFANRMDGKEAYPESQVAAGVELVALLMTTHGITLDAITTHEQIARPMGRKQDPGALFPLASFITRVRQRLARDS